MNVWFTEYKFELSEENLLEKFYIKLITYHMQYFSESGISYV